MKSGKMNSGKMMKSSKKSSYSFRLYHKGTVETHYKPKGVTHKGKPHYFAKPEHKKPRPYYFTTKGKKSSLKSHKHKSRYYGQYSAPGVAKPFNYQKTTTKTP